MIGQILRKRYQIIEKLGEGGMGETFLAEDLDMPVTPKPRCVVKRLHPPENPSHVATVHRLFNQEAQILYQLGSECPNIPKLYAYFQENQDFYLIQEYIEGQELTEELKDHQPWSEQQTLTFLKEILTILSYVHQNQVIHRDIKPQNIMRRQDGRLVLIDFGSVKQVSPLTVQKTVTIGTQGYMPIEQARGKPKLSSDIYAVGMIAIQGFTGMISQPLPEDESGEIRWKGHQKISDGLEKILTKMVRSDFRERYTDAMEVLTAINQLSDEANLLKKPPSQPLTTQVSITEETPINFQPFSSVSWLKRLFKPFQFSAKTQSKPTKNKEETPSHPSQVPLKTTSPPQVSPSVSSPLNIKLYPKKIYQKWGYLNQDQKVIIPPQFDEARGFSEGLASVRMGEKWGYIDLAGNWVMSPRFDEAENFHNGLAKITLGDKSGYINPQGKVIKGVHSSSPKNILLFPKKENHHYGYVDVNGRWIISPKFIDADVFSEGLAAVKIGSKYGYIDASGKVVIAPKFDLGVKFEKGVARVMINNQFYKINRQGEIID